MRLRPYIHSADFEYLEKWVAERRSHALWCAGLMPYPLSAEGLLMVLEHEWESLGGCAFTATDDKGIPLGFFAYSLDNSNNKGFFKFVVTDSEKRGVGNGRKMLEIALQYARLISGADTVQLNVFDVNLHARKLYESLGFVQDSFQPDALRFGDEQWGKCHMEISLA